MNIFCRLLNRFKGYILMPQVMNLNECLIDGYYTKHHFSHLNCVYFTNVSTQMIW